MAQSRVFYYGNINTTTQVIYLELLIIINQKKTTVSGDFRLRFTKYDISAGFIIA